MIISHSKKFVFLKSVKTASTSTERLLETVCTGEDIIGWRGPPPKPEGTEYYNHMKPSQIKAKMSEDDWNTYYKFGNVRNPWDRVVSSYFFRKDVLSKNPHNPTDWQDGESFEQFVLTRKLPGKLSVFFDGFTEMDFLIRFENIEEDIQTVSDTLNLNLNIDLLPHTHEGVREKDYKTYYNTETENFVAQYYAEEIAYLGYTF